MAQGKVGWGAGRRAWLPWLSSSLWRGAGYVWALIVPGFLDKWGEKRGSGVARNKTSSSLAFTRPGEENGKQCPQNGTVCCPLLSFFF